MGSSIFSVWRSATRKVSRRVWTMIGLALAVGSLMAGALKARQVCLPRFRAVRQGVLYRSGQPRGIGLFWVKWSGIRAVVNLRGPASQGSAAESDYCRRNQIGFDALRMATTGDQLDADVKRFLSVVRDPANWPVLVHCSRGKERSGVMSAIFRIEFDRWSNQQALYELYRQGLSPGSMPDAESYVWNYVPTWREMHAGPVPPPVAVWQE